jgi:hypothetical protein
MPRPEKKKAGRRTASKEPTESTNANAFVESLYYYPVKSCAGISLSHGEIGSCGFKYDRSWLIVDARGRFLTQRQLPIMALIKATVLADGGKAAPVLKLEAPGKDPFLVPDRAAAVPDEAPRAVTVWKDTAQAIDQGDEPAAWLSQYLGKEVRLVRMSSKFVRSVRKENQSAPESQVGFQDGYPFLIISKASLDVLNLRLPEPITMDRFRPNIVVDGCSAFAEDEWQTIQIGDVVFEIDKACARCTITTVDQSTAHTGVEPLRTLSTFRLRDNEVLFGQNAIHRTSGIIKVNDAVRVLKRRGTS